MIRRAGTLLACLLCALPAFSGGRDILFWAPYAPGSPEQASGALEEFARHVEKSAGWPAGSVTAAYRNTVDEGLAALEELDPGFVLVPLPVHLRYHEALGWKPLRIAVLAGQEAQRYSLYGPAGSSLDQLSRLRIEGDAAYDPVFVRSLVLDGRRVPDSQFAATSRPLSAIRRAVQGEPVAVLLDEGQRQALAALPAASDLMLLAESGWLPAAIVERRAGSEDADSDALGKVLDRLAEDPEAADLLSTLRMQRFQPVEPEALEKIQGQYQAATQQDDR